MGVKIPASFEDSTGTVVRLTGELEFDVPATPGQVLTADNPATTASFQAGGGGSAPIQTGAGSPLGAVVPTGIGYLYIDTTNGGVWIAQGATSADWAAVGGITANAATGIAASVEDGTATLQDGTGASAVEAASNFASVRAFNAGGVAFLAGAAGGLTVAVGDDGAGNPTLGFFNVTRVVQPTLTALSTAADIVAALQALGLSG